MDHEAIKIINTRHRPRGFRERKNRAHKTYAPFLGRWKKRTRDSRLDNRQAPKVKQEHEIMILWSTQVYPKDPGLRIPLIT